ncbi:hypothetical protein CG719_28640 [Streptomyces sp. CB01373]|nr:hypothetical protein CG719_28640 [Streptomyces sp. CB01373]
MTRGTAACRRHPPAARRHRPPGGRPRPPTGRAGGASATRRPATRSPLRGGALSVRAPGAATMGG